MGAANFSVTNANSYYAILETIEVENENGVMEEYNRDECDWDMVREDITYMGKETKLFPNPSSDWNRRIDGLELCCSDENWETFGNGNAWTTQTRISSVICIKSGYYADAVLDYDILVTTCKGDDFYLSEYDDLGDLVKDYLDCVSDIVDYQGCSHKWNIGTFKMHRKNIDKWITKRILDEVAKCEKFCKENSDTELAVSCRFSNGETWYHKVG